MRALVLACLAVLAGCIIDNDPVRVENVLGYALALQGAKVPMELHVYPTGGHGYGLRPAKDYVTTWPQRAADWMRSRGILGAEVSLPR